MHYIDLPPVVAHFFTYFESINQLKEQVMEAQCPCWRFELVTRLERLEVVVSVQVVSFRFEH